MATSQTRLAIVGAGYWGKNIVRTFHRILGKDLAYVCDLDSKRLERVRQDHVGIETTTDYNRLIQEPSIDAIVVATNATSHYTLAKQALEAGKHVYVEKPMTMEVDEAKTLVELAGAKKRVLMVGHILMHHPAIYYLKRLVDRGDLGRIYYMYAQRVNLGKVRSDENAMWSLAPHDLSLIFYLHMGELAKVTAHGQHYLKQGVQDVVFLNLLFDDGVMANVHLSWLDPHKKRQLTVVGDKKMVVFDDMEASEKLKIYDKGVEVAPDYKSYGELYNLRFGDIVIPRIDSQEPLYKACSTFLEAIAEGRAPLSCGDSGLRVVRALNAAQKSLERGGEPVTPE